MPSRIPSKAFTLLELIVVIVVLGILAAIAVPTFKAVIDRSRTSALTTTAEALDRDARALAAFELPSPGEEWRSEPRAWIGAAALELPDEYTVNQSTTAGSTHVFRISDTATTVYLATGSHSGDRGEVTSDAPAGLEWSADDLQTPATESSAPSGGAASLNLARGGGYEDSLSNYPDEIFGYWAAPLSLSPSSEAYAGVSSLKTTTDSSANPQGFIHIAPTSTSVTAGESVVVSAWVKGPAGVSAWFGGRAHDPATGASIAEAQGQVLFTFTGEWQKVQTSAWTESTNYRPGGQLRLATAASGVTLWMDDFQITPS